jgi:hypothetical protein
LAVSETATVNSRDAPELTRSDIQAVLLYAKDAILHCEVTPLNVA